MIIGAYYLTETSTTAPARAARSRRSTRRSLAYDERLAPATPDDERLSLHAKIKVRMPGARFPADQFPRPRRRAPRRHRAAAQRRATATRACSSRRTLGRFLFNEAFPADFPFHDDAVKKRDLTELVSKLVERLPAAVVAESLDKLKDLGFEFATRSGLTISIADVQTPPAKAGLLEKFEAEADKVESQYDRGIITDDERRQKEIEIWTEATARRSVTRCRPRCARTSSTPST